MDDGVGSFDRVNLVAVDDQDPVFTAQASDAWQASRSAPDKTEFGFAVGLDGSLVKSGPGSKQGGTCSIDLQTYGTDTLYTFHTHPKGGDEASIPDAFDKDMATQYTKANVYIGTTNGLWVIHPTGQAFKVADGGNPSEWFKTCHTSKQ